MPRTHHDTWDLATGVGTTATLVATARALATRWAAEPLSRAVGLDFFTKVASGERGYRRVYLTTGHRQPEAEALYEATGYTRLPEPLPARGPVFPIAFLKMLS